MKFLDIADYIRSEASGAPDFVIERAVRDAAIDFCIQTDVYRLEPEDIQVIAGIDEYDLSIPIGTELNHIIDIYRNREALRPVSYSRLLEVTGDGTQKGAPKYYSQRDNTVFYLSPVPNKAETLKVLYSVKPSPASTSIPDTIGREYREAFVHGALYRLQMMSGQPWSDLGSAQSNKTLFDRQSAKVMREVRYGYGGGALTVKSRAFI
jgi:hypothetical protein